MTTSDVSLLQVKITVSSFSTGDSFEVVTLGWSLSKQNYKTRIIKINDFLFIYTCSYRRDITDITFTILFSRPLDVFPGAKNIIPTVSPVRHYLLLCGHPSIKRHLKIFGIVGPIFCPVFRHFQIKFAKKFKLKI